MNNKHKDELLKDTLSEAASPEFRDALLQQSLGQVRQRRQRRTIARYALGLLLLGAISAVMWKATFRPSEQLPRLTRSSGQVEGVPLPGETSSNSVALTSPGLSPHNEKTNKVAESLILSSRPETVEFVHTARDSVTVVQTEEAPRWFKVINDDELLRLLAGRPAVLIRRGGFDAELRFTNPQDEDGFALPQ